MISPQLFTQAQSAERLIQLPAKQAAWAAAWAVLTEKRLETELLQLLLL